MFNNERLTVVSFEKDNFAYYFDDTKKSVNNYDSCGKYNYNSSVNVLKLNCDIKNNKVYIRKYNNDALSLTIDSSEKIFYATEELARISKFKIDNDLTDEIYNDLINIAKEGYLKVKIDDLIKTYNSKGNKLYVFVDDEINVNNVLNYSLLDSVIQNSSKEIHTIPFNSLKKSDFIKINKISSLFFKDSSEYVNKIIIYQVGNKKVKVLETLDVKSYKDLSEKIINLNL